MLLGCAIQPLSAQAHRVTATVDSLRNIQSVVPLHGPPGTEVSISTENLPLQAKVHVGVGSLGAGFETIGEAWQGEWGDVEATVRIPANTSWERPIFLIAFNAIFAPIGISEPFHVTDEEGRVQRTGIVGASSGSCVLLVDQDDQTYGLTGETGRIQEGDRVVLQGVFHEEGVCTDMPTITVSRIIGRRRGGS